MAFLDGRIILSARTQERVLLRYTYRLAMTLKLRFIMAMAGYALLALLAATTLAGKFRLAVLILLAGLIVMTCTAAARRG